MTSVMPSSRRSGSSGPRPMISSVICSSIRTRSARVRARPSSSMTLPKISSIWRRTSTWLERSSLGSRSWMTRFWMRNLTSRNDSRTGACESIRDGALGGGAAPPPVGTGVPGAAGAPGSDPGRALSIRFSSDIVRLPLPPGMGAAWSRYRRANRDFFWAGLGGRRPPSRRLRRSACAPAGRRPG